MQVDRLLALDQLRRERAAEWRALVDAVRRADAAPDAEKGKAGAKEPEWMPLVVPPSKEVLPRPTGLARQLEQSWRHTHNTWVRPWRKRCSRATGLSGFFSGKGRAR